MLSLICDEFQAQISFMLTGLSPSTRVTLRLPRFRRATPAGVTLYMMSLDCNCPAFDIAEMVLANCLMNFLMLPG